jgi:hypothetical protein
MQARRQLPTGYSTTVPSVADRTARLLRRLTCGVWTGTPVASLGIRYIAVHADFYAVRQPPSCLRAAFAGLRSHGFRQFAADGDVTIFARP